MTRRAIITGALSGLGAATGARLKDDGVDIITVDITPGADLLLDVADSAAVHMALNDLGPVDMNRVGKPEEVAELVAWLASDKCSFSTGAVYDISGGRATY